MIGPHLAQLRRVVDETENLPAATRAELLRLVRAVEAETAGAEVSDTHRDDDDAQEGDASVLDQLKQSIEELEATHPEAAAAVNRVASVLANMGI